jgi:phage head maturation protease
VSAATHFPLYLEARSRALAAALRGYVSRFAEVQARGRATLADCLARAAAAGCDEATAIRLLCEHLEREVFAPLREGRIPRITSKLEDAPVARRA